MAKVILVSGGARSGKSAYSEALAKSLPASRAYLATAPVIDDEMRQRVVRHQQQRKNDGWDTIEEEINLAETIENARGYCTLLVDCLTLWINNLLYAAKQQGREFNEDDMLVKCAQLETVCAGFNGNIIFVINEVGMGIVPDNPQARRFRDLSGRCSQSIARFADRVILMSCGLPLVLKTEPQL
ncbi:MAG: bifunctional adenosylcobinamide kinase/adenosylcobinamide-phosphate guanylyltransferase [Victivallales bacterium]|nr:bifunctional adenosylcobinamide kinase/adenosylcobinamide-phosphate guanylyltransferase [Victivallales bacterium]